MRMPSDQSTLKLAFAGRGELRFPSLPTALALASGVYRVLAERALPRLRGESPVLYVGSAERLGDRLTPRHHVLPQLASLTAELDLALTLEVHGVAAGEAPLGLPEDAWARLLETHALADYQRKHLELPPLNRRSEGFVPGRAMEAVAQVLAGKDESRIRGHLLACDEAWSAVTYVPLLVRGRSRQPRHRPMPQVLWTWPEKWWPGETPWWRSRRGPGGQSTPLLTADVLYFFAPVDHALAPLAGMDADRYDFAQEGGAWVYRRLTRPGWLDLTATPSTAELAKAIEGAARVLLPG